jgi:hypothetical protein
MSKQQTAVEWLIQELTPSIKLQQKYIDELETKANKMFEQQIIEACNYGDFEELLGEKYYNETFKSE